jgi:deoxyhypusine synthase
MHKYALQITVADVRDGALSSSTLLEASSWGKVDTVFEQMVYAEATLALPLIASYAWHKGSWRNRKLRRFSKVLEEAGFNR